MKTINKFLMVMSFLVVFSCNKEETNEIAESNLINCWTHSFEENDTRSQYTYRPCDYTEFPLSRYRQVYNFNKDGTCTYTVLAPDDGHYTESGEWDFNETTNLISISKDGQIVLELEVAESENNLLMLWQ